MLKRIKYIDGAAKCVLIMSEKSNEAWAIQNGFSAELYDVEQGYDGNWYLVGHAPALPLDQAKATKISELDAEATSRITSGFWYADVAVFDGNLHFSFGTEDQINFSDTMTGASLALTADSSLADMLPSSVTWNGYTDEAHTNLVTVTFTAAQFLAFWSYAQTLHKQAILDTVRGLKAVVVAAETVEEIYAVSWPMPVPTDENSTNTERE